MSRIERMAADVCSGTPYARDTVTAHEVIQIPEADRGKFWSFIALTTDVYIRFGEADTVEVDIAARSTVGAGGALTADGTEAHIIVPAGGEVHRRLKPSWTHFAHESAANTGVLSFGPAQGSSGAE